MRSGLIFAISLAASPAASDFLLQIPVDCDLGETCHIQNYVDHQPSEAAMDFRCGDLVYDGHKGTDFALPTLAEMAKGVDVLAAAPGIIRGVRDGMVDQRYDPGNTPSVSGRECGNGMVIEHENGWETQYCHLQRGSVTVTKGDRVEAGAVLGKIGLSGLTQFPHLHLSVRKDGEVVDPFVPDGELDCQPSTNTLWQTPPDYVPGGIVSLGFADGIPDYDAVLAGTAARDSLPGEAPALVLYGHAFGSQAGDILRLEVVGPQGNVFDHDVELEKTQAQVYRATGLRLKQPSWPTGAYTGTVSMIRDGRVISRESTMVELQ